MSRYHRDNPDQTYTPAEKLAGLDDPRPLVRCAGCGEPTRRGHWCSDSCRRAEDGLSADEAEALYPVKDDDD